MSTLTLLNMYLYLKPCSMVVLIVAVEITVIKGTVGKSPDVVVTLSSRIIQISNSIRIIASFVLERSSYCHTVSLPTSCPNGLFNA